MFAYYLHLAWRRCRQNLPMVALLALTMAIGIASCMTALTIFGALGQLAVLGPALRAAAVPPVVAMRAV